MTSGTSNTSHTSASVSIAPTKALHLGSGDPLLLLHGLLLSPHYWEQAANRLATQCEVFAPTLAGHWGGPESQHHALGARELADHVEAQLDEMGWRTCHIAGHSLGAAVGVELARRGRARTLTAIAPTGGWTSSSPVRWRAAWKFAALIPLVWAGKHLGGFPVGNPLSRWFAARALTKHPSAVSRRDITAVLTAALGCPAPIPLITGLLGPALDDLSTLHTPVRLLLAEADHILPCRVYARRYLRELPDIADRILVNGVGHAPMLEAPDRIATLIAEHVYASRTHLRAV
uniref:alpha/beta fold hydrolase n=1 Tax=Nocardia donostiensis TaxID=1538463 RepID=UPI0009D97CD4|nr:alpha/beta hydrolase [Nocardia donostiensis]